MDSGAERDLNGLRVLVADDELFLAMELEDIVDSFGCVAIGPVSRVAEIRTIASREALDAAILDVNLAGERSYAAAIELRRSGIAVVFVTGYGDLLGCPEELTGIPRVEKPFTGHQIAEALSVALTRAGR